MCTAILLNYRRPQNIDPIVCALLRTPSVQSVIVSNNNPRCNLQRWVRVRDDRVVFLLQPCERNTAERFRIALQTAAQEFLAVDDDIFLTPRQYEALCSALRWNPTVPHGICGQVWREDGTFQHGICGVEREVDVLNRAYAFTREHGENFRRLLEHLGMWDDAAAWQSSAWDDLVISVAGMGKPLCHDVGPFRDCPTQAGPDAVWRREEFFAFRERFYPRLCAAAAALQLGGMGSSGGWTVEGR